MAKIIRALAVVTTAFLVVGTAVSSSEAAVASRARSVIASGKKATNKKKNKHTAVTTTTSVESETTVDSLLSPNACVLSLEDQGKLAPAATMTVGGIPEGGGDIGPVSLPNPVPVDIKESGKHVTCTVQVASSSNPQESNIVFDVVDFPGPTGVDAAKHAYATVKTAYQKSGPPQDVAGLGDEAFTSKRENGGAQAFVTRQGEVLVRVDGSQGSSTVDAPLDFDALQAATATVLAKAVAETPSAGTSGSSDATTTNPKGNSGSGQLTSTGAINATWDLRVADLGVTEGCSVIPLITDDGKLTGWVNPSPSGQVTFHTTKFSQNLLGNGATVELPSGAQLDEPHPAFHVTIDATVKDQFTGKSAIKLKGSFDYNCAIN